MPRLSKSPFESHFLSIKKNISRAPALKSHYQVYLFQFIANIKYYGIAILDNFVLITNPTYINVENKLYKSGQVFVCIIIT